MTITDHNRPIAQVVPISSIDSPVKQLVTAGILSHSPEPYKLPATTAPQSSKTDSLLPRRDVVSLLDREDRL